jgi:hypothetical protein
VLLQFVPDLCKLETDKKCVALVRMAYTLNLNRNDYTSIIALLLPLCFPSTVSQKPAEHTFFMGLPLGLA